MNKYINYNIGIIVSLFWLSWVGCNLNFDGPSNSETQEPSVEEVIEISIHSILLTNVDQLRLRRYGDIKSGMVTTFDENTPLLFMDEETDYEETIGGYKGTWKRVSTLDRSYSGWVFGAEHFVEEWISKDQLDSLKNEGIGIQIFSNKTKNEMTELTGASFDKSTRGTRFSGYYEYKLGTSPALIDGRVSLRARVFNTESKEVSFIPCEILVERGMPKTDLSLECEI